MKRREDYAKVYSKNDIRRATRAAWREIEEAIRDVLPISELATRVFLERELEDLERLRQDVLRRLGV